MVSAVSGFRSHIRLSHVLLSIGLVVYGVLLAIHIGAHASGADNSGYLNHARLLREGRIHTPTRALQELPAKKLSAFAYVPLGFTPAEPGDPTNMVPIYPVGLPLLIAGVSWIVGFDAAPRATMLLHALGGVLLMYALARRAGLARSLATLGAVLLAVSPQYVFGSLQAMSDMPALGWTTLAIYLVWRKDTSLGGAAAAGMALAMAVLIRPTNAMAIVPVAVALGRDGRRWLALIGAGMPGAILFLVHNHVSYGHVLASGYGPIWQEFDLRHAPGTLLHYLKWTPVVLTPLSVLALGLPWVWRQRPREAAILMTWIGAFAGLYLFYPYTNDDWWYLRFVLPVFPAVILALLFVMSQGAEHLMAARAKTLRVGATVSAGFVVLWALPWNYELHSYSVGRNERAYVEATDWARRNIPDNAVIFAMQATGALYYYTPLAFIHWTLVSPQDLAAIEAAAAARGRPIFAMLFPFEEAPFLNRVYVGKWKRVAQVRHISVWRCE